MMVYDRESSWKSYPGLVITRREVKGFPTPSLESIGLGFRVSSKHEIEPYVSITKNTLESSSPGNQRV